jgi:hypothetical protein|tara:strand:- start:220 stop:369 length:150 start_codon:yes stop_codon:yes gene_type:complete
MGFIKKIFKDVFLCSCIEKKTYIKKENEEDDLSSDEEYRDIEYSYESHV